jgi:hypothetical protein
MGQVKLDYEKVRRMVASTSHGSGKVTYGKQGFESSHRTFRVGSRDGGVQTSQNKYSYNWVAKKGMSIPYDR